jgi:hypothetical protein
MDIPRLTSEEDHRDWAVIELVSGQIRAVPDAIREDRVAPHEPIIWQGEARSEHEALLKAAQADPRVDLKYRRIRHEDSLGFR